MIVTVWECNFFIPEANFLNEGEFPFSFEIARQARKAILLGISHVLFANQVMLNIQFFVADSPFVIDLKSSSSSCSVLVNGTEHSRNDLGINVVVLDPVTLNVEETESFDTGHFPDASIKLTEYLQSLPLMSMVFVVVRGEGNFFLTGAIFFW